MVFSTGSVLNLLKVGVIMRLRAANCHVAMFQVITFKRKAPFDLKVSYAADKLPSGTSKDRKRVDSSDEISWSLLPCVPEAGSLQDLGTYTIEVPLQDAPKKVKALSTAQWIMINKACWHVFFHFTFAAGQA